MYVCGVTVYDDIHMGHARSIIVFDMIARYLRYRGYKVTHLTNFTDVDDKIINRAAEEGVDPLSSSQMYIEQYFQDVDLLGVTAPTLYPKASENIAEIIAMTQKIIDNGYGYRSDDGSVYFSRGQGQGLRPAHRPEAGGHAGRGAGRGQRAEAQPLRLRAVEGRQAG